jgi:acetyl esterase
LPYRFDPELAPWVALVAELDLSRPEHARAELAAAAARRAERPGGHRPAREVAVEDVLVPAGTGGADVPVRVYTPEPAGRGDRGGVVFLHSGGFVVGSVAVADSWTRTMAAELDAVVVSVDYRLAPEHPYPAALEDGWTALEWTVKQVDELGIDPTRVAVAGESAGAALATALAMLALDRGGPAICFQSLANPALDDRLATQSMQQFVDTPMWNRPNAELSWRAYLRGVAEPGSQDVPDLAAPARRADLRGLPPAFVSVAEFDPLRDEGVDHAMRLVRAGVPTELHLYPGTFHGSRSVEHADVSQRMTADLLGTLGRALAPPPAD